ncbi:MAG TPA: nicotinate-nucleotide adenylyltransferase [Luteimonas sp.]|nr:nicotinate-nucleotide adenylyltransferase [Luteimonas sp.]
MSLLVCYGGSFDPVHAGHLAVACAVRDGLGAQVRLLPAADPPHKPSTFAGQSERAHMLALAIGDQPDLVLDLREYTRPGPSWTVDTLHSLRAELGAGQPIAWLVGSDALPGLHTWHDWPRLFELAHVLVVERPGAPLDLAHLRDHSPTVHAALQARRRDAGQLADSPGGGYAGVTLPQLRTESSTEVRRRIAAGLSCDGMLAPAVAAYIRQHALYGPPAVPGHPGLTGTV